MQNDKDVVSYLVKKQNELFSCSQSLLQLDEPNNPFSLLGLPMGNDLNSYKMGLLGASHDDFLNRCCNFKFTVVLDGDMLDTSISPTDELYYTDEESESLNLDEMKKDWLRDAYGKQLAQSKPKTYLLKLIEYNKIVTNESMESAGQTQERNEISRVIFYLMKQGSNKNEYKQYIENYQFQGVVTEQRFMVMEIIKLVRKNILILYKKCFNFLTVRVVQKQKKTTFVHFKDTKLERGYYISFVNKIADLYDKIKEIA